MVNVRALYELRKQFAVICVGLISVVMPLVWYWGAVDNPGRVCQLQLVAEGGPDNVFNDDFAWATAESLGGSERYLSHISSDKPVYRPGETVYLRSVTLHHATQQPVPESLQRSLYSLVQIIGPKGDPVAQGDAGFENSVMGFSWTVPPETPGGEYMARITYGFPGFAPAERRFDIRAFRAPRLNTQLKFLRDGYGAGDAVVATLKVERAEGGVPDGAAVAIQARVAGENIYQENGIVDRSGKCTARFTLPAELHSSDATLSMTIDDNGVVETATKTIPILLNEVDIQVVPESGSLLNGVANRVYFSATATNGRPADVAGHVIDDHGKLVARFRSEHEGRGRFEFQPDTGRSYHMVILEPTGIDATVPLPAAADQGAVIQAGSELFHAGEPIRVKVSTTESDCTLVVHQREIQLARQTLDGIGDPARSAWAALAVPDEAHGVLVVSCVDREGNHLAERLVFRKPADHINIRLTPDSDSYVPGGKARFNVTTTDQNGDPVSATVGLSVTDLSAIEMIETREQPPQLPAMALLEHEVKKFADTTAYLDPANGQAHRAIDLLLGVQDWRRFGFLEMANFVNKHGDAARRVLACGTVMPDESIFDNESPNSMEFRRDQHGDAVEVAPALLVAENERQLNVQKQELPQKSQKDFELDKQKFDGQNQLADKLEEELADAEASSESAQRRGGRRRLAQLARKNNAGGGGLGGGFGDEFWDKNDFVANRAFAFQARPGRRANERLDFTETIYWNCALNTDASGSGQFEFDLSDSVTSFRASADAFAQSGALGATSMVFRSVKPFYTEARMPLEVTQGDVIQMPVIIANATNQPMTGIQFESKGPRSFRISSDDAGNTVGAHSRLRRIITVEPGAFTGEASLSFHAAAGEYSDSVIRPLKVVPRGFPNEVGQGGLLEPDSIGVATIRIPDSTIPASISAEAIVYPSPMASMTEALKRLIREPSGCFEQTSSTTYPLVMAQRYFMSHHGVDAALIEDSNAILQRGYERLLGFESANGGFEWFGNDPGHDALTAYGLVQFTDMSKVMSVDPEMLNRTRQWLLDQRDGKGGYRRLTGTLHTWLADPEVAFSYNTWALLQSGVDADLATEVEWVNQAAQKTESTYVMALAANVMALAGNRVAEEQLLDKLAGYQLEDGSVDNSGVTVVGSSGVAAAIEATAFATMAWLRNPNYLEHAEQGVRFLAENCKAGRFASTQATVLALQAIVRYDEQNASPKSVGSVQLVVDGNPVGYPVSFNPDSHGPIRLPDFSRFLVPGEHTIELRMANGSRMPWSVTASFNSLKKNSSESCNLELSVEADASELQEGENTEVVVSVRNRTDAALPNPVAIIGIPGGLEVRHDQLKELVKQQRLAAYEVLGRKIVLYWRVLDADQEVAVPISLVAEIPGQFQGPASCAYQYYTDEHKTWVDGFDTRIAPIASQDQ